MMNLVAASQPSAHFSHLQQGLIPIVGAARETGTSMLIEDVACPVDKLADMIVDLVEMFQRHGYNDASCFGHALEGNLHLVFAQVRRGFEHYMRVCRRPCWLVFVCGPGRLLTSIFCALVVSPTPPLLLLPC